MLNTLNSSPNRSVDSVIPKTASTSGIYGNMGDCITTYPAKYNSDSFQYLSTMFIYKEKLAIKKVIFSYPATIILWTDGQKTVVKCGDKDNYDPEKGLALAIAKRFMGNKGNYYNEFKKWIPKAQKDIASTLSKNKPKPIGTVISKDISDDGVKVRVRLESGFFSCPGYFMANNPSCMTCADSDSCKAMKEENGSYDTL